MNRRNTKNCGYRMPDKHRDDEWGGSYESRIRFPLEIVRRTRELVGENFIIIYRLSMLDLVDVVENLFAFVAVLYLFQFLFAHWYGLHFL